MRRKEKKRKSLPREIFGWFFYLFLILAVIFLLIQFVGQRTVVQGSSMYPTLLDGDGLIVDKLTYKFSDPERFDVVVFPFRYQEDTYYIKRIIGLPGETVQIRNGEIYINGRLLEEEYGWGEMKSGGLASEPVILGEDEYVVLGDNRNSSSDSREPSVGNIEESQLIGRAWMRVWPLSGLGLIH